MASIEFTLDGTITKVNENFLKVMGYQEAELIGQPHRRLCSPEFANSREYAQLWDQLRSGRFFSGQIKRIARDGSERWLEASYNPVFDESGKVVSVIKFATDITANVQTQKQERDSACLPSTPRSKPVTGQKKASTTSATASAISKTWPTKLPLPPKACSHWASTPSKSAPSCKPSRTLPTKPICWP
jgi:PAS domain S-box-containing protein